LGSGPRRAAVPRNPGPACSIVAPEPRRRDFPTGVRFGGLKALIVGMNAENPSSAGPELLRP
jgi:hypothetical protein